MLDHVNEYIVELLIKHLRGKSTTEEQQAIRIWLNESAENKRLYDEMNDIWKATSKKDEQVFDSFRALKLVKRRTFQNDKKQTGKIALKQSMLRIAQIAAIFILAFIFGIFFNRRGTEKINGKENATTEIKAPIGSKTIVTLPDGTKVWLNAGSVLRYDSYFNHKNREVSLEGEAFFDVTKKNGKLFLVKTKEITIRVLGTAFNVKAYPNEGSIETTLVRGALIVEQQSKEKGISQTALEPNQRAVFIKKDGNLYLSENENQSIKQETVQEIERTEEKIILSKNVDTEVFTAWKENRLIFRNELFESLVVKLERWYGVKIIIKDEEIKKFHFNGIIVNETIQDVMKIIQYTLPLNYSIEHNVITIIKK